MLRNDDAGASDEQRLAVRATHLREIIAWVDELVKQERDTAALEEPRWVRPAEIVRHHDDRRAGCRGRPKVLLQELLATLVVNARRIVQMLCAQSTPTWA